MGKVKRATRRNVLPDPITALVFVDIDGEKFQLSFDFGALATAKAKLREAGIQLNVLRSLDFESLDADTLPAMFFAACQQFQPYLTWERARRLVNLRTGAAVIQGLVAAYVAAMAEPKQGDPLTAAPKN
jgi:esterase/lipase superfamily enzyme